MKKTKKTDTLTAKFWRMHPDTCAAVTFSAAQKFFYFLLASALLILLKYRWDLFLFLVSLFLLVIYLSAVQIKLTASVLCLCGYGVKKVSEQELRSITDFPVFTILVPLYHEPEITAKILPRLNALDYPKDKLDVKILLEQDDTITQNVLQQVTLPDWVHVIKTPDSALRTKPRACNYGLKKAAGEFCVIYDAEDIPEPDQLKKVLCVFRADPRKKLACVQAKLNYFNARQNWLTKFFTVEYTTYFDLVLGGWNCFGIPLPLGGTSNHFRTEFLKALGGWDPFNVTEDCELGIRIYEAGWKTAVVESTTWEEANSRTWNWLRQRSRWVKGFIQTHLSHMRHPLRTLSKIGFRGLFGGYLSVGGSALMMLTNVIFWPLTLFYLLLLIHGVCCGDSVMTQITATNAREGISSGIRVFDFVFQPWPLIYTGTGENAFWSGFSKISFVCSVFLLLSNVFLIIIHAAACIRRKFYFLVPWSLLMPFYWIMISVGAWKGFIQIFTKPHYWEKTVHGLNTLPFDREMPPTNKVQIQKGKQR